MYDWLIGGKDNYPVDEQLGLQMLALEPAAAPDARIVYADNDPIVLAHAAALLHGTPEG